MKRLFASFNTMMMNSAKAMNLGYVVLGSCFAQDDLRQKGVEIN